MKKGDRVRFKEPMLDEDPSEVYILVEDPAPQLAGPPPHRLDVMPVSMMNWPIPPVNRVNAEDIEVVP